jgi:hypothetical protein
MPKPDLRVTGSIASVVCAQTGVPPGCTAGEPYNPTPNGSTHPYTSGGNGSSMGAQPPCFPTATSTSDCIAGADMIMTAELGNPGNGTGGGATGFAGHAVRLTDSYNCQYNPPPTGCPANNPTGHYPATLSDIQIPIRIDCGLPYGGTPPPGAVSGAACAVNTTANAVAPGLVLSGKAASWEIGEITIKDSGPDGLHQSGGGDAQTFLVQGGFVP